MSGDSDRVLGGGCACGTVRYEAKGPFRDVIACHCESCRRQSGHIVAATLVARDGLTIVSGEADIRWWEATPHARRGFCSLCGSLLFWTRQDSETVSILAGTLDAPTGLKLTEHIYVAEKSDYYDISDGLPRHAGTRET